MFLAQTRAVYCATMTSSLRAIKRKRNEEILEMHKILLLFFNYSIKILNYYIVILLKLQWDIFIFTKNMTIWLRCFEYLFYSKLIFLRLNSYFISFHIRFLKLSHYKLYMKLFYGDKFEKQCVLWSNFAK